MTRLCDILSNKIGSKVEIEGIELFFKRITIGVIRSFQTKESSVEIKDVFSTISNDPFGKGVDFIFYLLTDESKNQFDNDLDMFRNCLSLDDIMKMQKCVADAIMDAYPSTSLGNE
jgi:replication initiation and membrane attachment protein DnaB